MDPANSIQTAIRMRGPSSPMEVAKAINTNSLMASAMLADMVSRHLLCISSMKVGSSPLYYLPGQEEKLLQFTRYLNEKDQRTVSLLNNSKLLRESELDPLTRVSLRQIADFAKPLKVTIHEREEIFWKWYLLSNPEAEQQIRLIVEGRSDAQDSPQGSKSGSEMIQEASPDAQSLDSERQTGSGILQEASIAGAEANAQNSFQTEVDGTPVDDGEGDIINLGTATAEDIETISTTTMVVTESPSSRGEIQAALHDHVISKPDIKAAADAGASHGPSSSRRMEECTKEEIRDAAKNDDFFTQLLKYFNKSRISVQSFALIKRNSEIDFRLLIPSPVGDLTFYCKAKNKKRIAEADITSAYVQGVIKKLPVLLLIQGELSKSSKELLSSEEFKNLVIQRI